MTSLLAVPQVQERQVDKPISADREFTLCPADFFLLVAWANHTPAHLSDVQSEFSRHASLWLESHVPNFSRKILLLSAPKNFWLRYSEDLKLQYAKIRSEHLLKQTAAKDLATMSRQDIPEILSQTEKKGLTQFRMQTFLSNGQEEKREQIIWNELIHELRAHFLKQKAARLLPLLPLWLGVLGALLITYLYWSQGSIPRLMQGLVDWGAFFRSL